MFVGYMRRQKGPPMQTIVKKAGQELVILNLTDIHMDDSKLQPDSGFLTILHHTLDTLMQRVQPDLVTITGDLAWGGHHAGQAHLVSLLDRYGVPWAPVLGNHDHEVDDAGMKLFEGMFAASPCCLYRPGPAELGNGNYTILVQDEATGKPVTGLIFMDSHNNAEYTNELGEKIHGYAMLWPRQLTWYAEQVKQLRQLGCGETALFQHIPPYGYRQAFEAAFRSDLDPKSIPAPLGTADCWNPGYKNSTGVHYESVGCAPIDDGVLDALLAAGAPSHIFCGHEHINNWQITYRDINLVYTLKTGCGCYAHTALNGGTVIRVGDTGICSVQHSYVELSPALVQLSDEWVNKA